MYIFIAKYKLEMGLFLSQLNYSCESSKNYNELLKMSQALSVDLSEID